jgi:hypothetical protein
VVSKDFNIIMRSFTIRENKMWWLIPFLESMKKKGPYFPSLSLSQIDSRMFAKNGGKTPNSLA